MKFNKNVVSVILPVYNASKYLPGCLESLKEQSYQDIQIIAIDDHSRDKSLTILKDFQKELKGLEVYRNKKRYGLAICYNRALKQAKGQFIAFMNPHDMNAVNRFKRQVNFLLNNPKTVAVGTQYTSIDENNRKMGRSNLPEQHEHIYENVLQSSTLHPETVMLNRELLPKDLLYFKSSKYPLVFTEVFVKLFQYGKVVNITHSLYYHRIGIKRQGRKSSRLKHVFSMAKLWITIREHNDYLPPLRSLFPPLVKRI